MKNPITIENLETLLPTEEEVKKEMESISNSPLVSIAESVHKPSGFKDGVDWVIEKLKQNINKLER